MDHTALMVLLSLCSSATSDVRLVGGASRCSGRLEVKDQGLWREVEGREPGWNLKSAAEVCRRLDCGFLVSLIKTVVGSRLFVIVKVTCSDSVRLVNGTGLCSGRLEVNTERLNQSWSSVSLGGFHQRDADVVCRELGCGPPSVLQGALYGDPEAPTWSREFQCEGSEAALLDCESSVRNSSGEAVGLTCSEPDESIRLAGGDRRCSGTLELKHRRQWKPVHFVNPTAAGEACRQLDCGSLVSTQTRTVSDLGVLILTSNCDGSSLIKCLDGITDSSAAIEITCSDWVRLVGGADLCSGRLEVNFNHSWSSVCEHDFDLQDAEVVCREMNCGPPSALQGALYGETEAPVWRAEFHCEGNESALLDCRRSGSYRKTCSPGRAVGLTCSGHDVRLVGGAHRCSGTLQMKHSQVWRTVALRNGIHGWTQKETNKMCQILNCGSAVSTQIKRGESREPAALLDVSCFKVRPLMGCMRQTEYQYPLKLEVICSDWVRLVGGADLCSGRLEVNFNHSWSSVCEHDFDLQDAEVVCREMNCGPPSALQGALYGETEAPVWRAEFHCGGNESALLDCRRSGSYRKTCSPGRAVGLTCSVSIRLVGESSRCAGTLEMLHQGQWRPVVDWDNWDRNSAAAVCSQLGCGSVVFSGTVGSSDRPVWWIQSSCLQTRSLLRDCVSFDYVKSNQSTRVVCSDLLVEPQILLFSSTDGVSNARKQGSEVLIGSDFSIMCSVKPQYQGGSFQLIFITNISTQNYFLPAVNHSALFLFSAAGPAHQGTYSCFYHVHVFNHNFSSTSQQLRLVVSGSWTDLIIRLVVVLLGLMVSVLVLYFYFKVLYVKHDHPSDQQQPEVRMREQPSC